MNSRLPKRVAGSSAFRLSTVGLGCWSFGSGEYWGPIDQHQVDAVVRHAVDLGIDYFDTAEAYEGGRSEESLGRAIQGLRREDLVIGSKISPTHVYPDMVAAHCEASLRRLGTDYLDLYMLHWPLNTRSLQFFTEDPRVIENPPTLEGAAEGLLRLQEQGKIRHIGVSNFGVGWLEAAARCGLKPAVNQLAYNLLSRAIEYELLPYCRQHGIGIVGYSALMQGVLSERYPSLAEVPAWQRRTRHFSEKSSPLSRHGEEGVEAETQQALEEIRAIARELGRSTADVAIAWAVHEEAITCALVGARSAERLEENARAALVPLPEEAIARLNAVTATVKERLGPYPDYFESPANDRTTLSPARSVAPGA